MENLAVKMCIYVLFKTKQFHAQSINEPNLAAPATLSVKFASTMLQCAQKEQ